MVLISLQDAINVLELVKFENDEQRWYAFHLMEQIPVEGEKLGYQDGFADGYKLGREDAQKKTTCDDCQEFDCYECEVKKTNG